MRNARVNASLWFNKLTLQITSLTGKFIHSQGQDFDKNCQLPTPLRTQTAPPLLPKYVRTAFNSLGHLNLMTGNSFVTCYSL